MRYALSPQRQGAEEHQKQKKNCHLSELNWTGDSTSNPGLFTVKQKIYTYGMVEADLILMDQTSLDKSPHTYICTWYLDEELKLSESEIL